MNGWFLEISEEMLADLPFIFGMMMALYGWERLRIGEETSDPDRRNRTNRAVPVVFLLLGLAICGVMRPTFWILAIAWVMTCAWGLIKGRIDASSRSAWACWFFVWIAVALVDPRVRGFHPLAGGYERDALHAAQSVGDRILKNFVGMMTSELAYGFFGAKWVIGVTELMNFVAIAAVSSYGEEIRSGRCWCWGRSPSRWSWARCRAIT